MSQSATLAPPPAAQDSSSESLSDKKRVLVVDDFDDGREMYAEYLEFAGFQVETACNGQEAVEKAQNGSPDIILMDLSLPVMDGWEATRLIKQDTRTRDIPVMALSGHVLAGSENQAKEAGADEFVAKPCLPKDLENKIRSMLKPSKAKGKP
jgi:two-component system, cell cycle response regulator DivK